MEEEEEEKTRDFIFIENGRRQEFMRRRFRCGQLETIRGGQGGGGGGGGRKVCEIFQGNGRRPGDYEKDAPLRSSGD